MSTTAIAIAVIAILFTVLLGVAVAMVVAAREHARLRADLLEARLRSIEDARYRHLRKD
jgi:type II secretory pathway pseudopilin PulG